jgi:hypothetical protein
MGYWRQGNGSYLAVMGKWYFLLAVFSASRRCNAF